jgi:hypothetical protein
MKYLTILLITACVATSCGSNENTTAKATEDNGDTIVDASIPTLLHVEDSATIAQNMEAYAALEAPHKMMATWNGVWEGEMSMWNEQDTVPMVAKGIATNKMILGGRYQESTYKANMMGMAFEGMGLTAFDNAKKVFITTWADNVGTGLMVLEGPWDETTRIMTLKGKMVDPAAGSDREIEVREVYKVIDNNHHKMQMFTNGVDGKERKMIEINYTRKGS